MSIEGFPLKKVVDNSEKIQNVPTFSFSDNPEVFAKQSADLFNAINMTERDKPITQKDLNSWDINIRTAMLFLQQSIEDNPNPKENVKQLRIEAAGSLQSALEVFRELQEHAAN